LFGYCFIFGYFFLYTTWRSRVRFRSAQCLASYVFHVYTVFRSLLDPIRGRILEKPFLSCASIGRSVGYPLFFGCRLRAESRTQTARNVARIFLFFGHTAVTIIKTFRPCFCPRNVIQSIHSLKPPLNPVWKQVHTIIVISPSSRV